MRARNIVGNIYKQFGNIIVGDVASIEPNNDVTKLSYMRQGHLNERGMMELQKRNILKGVCSCELGCASIIYLGNNFVLCSRLRSKNQMEF